MDAALKESKQRH
ncbi:hypothetical protein EMCRGX_G030338 [Ephydatia muelleri]